VREHAPDGRDQAIKFDRFSIELGLFPPAVVAPVGRRGLRKAATAWKQMNRTVRPNHERGSSEPMCRPPLYAGDRRALCLNGQSVRSQPLPQDRDPLDRPSNESRDPNEVRATCSERSEEQSKGCYRIHSHRHERLVTFQAMYPWIAIVRRSLARVAEYGGQRLNLAACALYLSIAVDDGISVEVALMELFPVGDVMLGFPTFQSVCLRREL
jgi:hypothetical protein